MHPSKWIVTCVGIGLAPRAPGTWGSLPGLLLGWAIFRLGSGGAWFPLVNVVCLIVACALAWWSIDWYEAVHETHDDGSTVIDEVVGMAIGVAFIPPRWDHYLLAFLLFRILDVTKPGPIGWADRHLGKGAGTLLDDVIAGVATSAMITLLSLLSN